MKEPLFAQYTNERLAKMQINTLKSERVNSIEFSRENYDLIKHTDFLAFEYLCSFNEYDLRWLDIVINAHK